MTTRRAFLATLAAATALPRMAWADLGSPAYLAAGKAGDAFLLHGLTATGDSLFRITLPARGHAAAAHPSQALAVAFARRPGTFALVIDCATGLTRHQLTPPPGRQFNGHGSFSRDGDLLMTSEVVAEGSAGRIGLWETAGFTRIGEWDSHGTGPHDMKRLEDGRLIIANGGIQTDPSDRTKLNLPTMRPNLTLLAADGTLLDQADLPDLYQNSIRHLALTATGVAFAMQWQGDPAEAVPLLGLWSPGSPIKLCPPAEGDALTMQGYAGSIAVDPSDGIIAMTSAPGGVVMLFDADGTPLTTLHRADISGAAASPTGLGPTGFVATDGQGAIWSLTRAGLTLLNQHTTLWDNHLVAIGPVTHT
ncbi:MAG: DUF1513 domain-containing protein [Candidatus Saccharibacteria bacterium]|nr:DUF1513 domain-containing protein [Pseudorhodobacter sp.]